jgi:hypothetical protein
MKNLLAVIGDGSAGPVLEAALMAAQRFDSHVVGLHSLTTEYAVVFGGEMGFSISSEVDRTLEREGHERRDQARRLFREFMAGHGVPIGVPAPGQAGPSASWREEDGRQNAVVGMSGRVYDLILVEQPEKLASIAEATLEDALFESGRPVLMVPKNAARKDGRGHRDRLERQHRDGDDRRPRHAVPETGARSRHRRGRGRSTCPNPVRLATNWPPRSNGTASTSACGRRMGGRSRRASRSSRKRRRRAPI